MPSTEQGTPLKRILAWRLFSRRDDAVGILDIIRWWEIRRIAFNLTVGAAGVVTLVGGVVVDLISEKRLGEPLGLPDPPLFALFGIFAYGVCANICYTGGWVAELAVKIVRRNNTKTFAETSFFTGLVLSILLTLSPTLFFASILIFRLFHR